MFRCSKCKGTNISVAMWVNPNTDRVQEDFGSWNETDTKWCDDCQEHRLIIDDVDLIAPVENPIQKFQYLVRSHVHRSIVIEAETEQKALEKSYDISYDSWGDEETEYEAELVSTEAVQAPF